MKIWVRIVITVLALLFSVANADELYPGQLCEHVWQMVYETESAEDDAFVIARSTRMIVVDAGDYHAVVTYTMNRCMRCGIEQEMPITTHEPHEYRVESAEPVNEDAVYAIFQCAECEHIRREMLPVAIIKATTPESTEVSCMYGGACPAAHMFDQAYIGSLIQVGKSNRYAVQVTLTENGETYTKLATRLHCPFCGRPQMVQLPADEVDVAVLETVPVMSYEEFMEWGTNPKSPYKLIDQIRNQK